MLIIEADIYEYVRMSYVDKNILGPLVHMYTARVLNSCASLNEVGTTFHPSKRVKYTHVCRNRLVWVEIFDGF